MQNETKGKKTWQTPECVDLDVNKTYGSKGGLPRETIYPGGTTSVGPS